MERIWLRHYQEGVAHDINLEAYTSLAEFFERCCDKFATNLAFETMGTAITYQKTYELSLHFAAYLQSLGIQPGARVAIMMPNLLQYPVALFGILTAGYVVVNTNPLYTADEVSHQLSDAGVEALVVLANFADTVEKARAAIPTLKHIIITEIGDLFPLMKKTLVNFIVKHVKKMVPDYTLPEAVHFGDALTIGRQTLFQKVNVHPENLAFLQYTGGTTGVSKAAKLTHRNMLANVLQADAWISPITEENKEVIVTALPLYHIFSLTANCLTYFQLGAKNVLITNPRDITGFIKTIKNIEFTTITGVNTLYNALLNHPNFAQVNFSKLKLSLAGGMALQESVSNAWQALTHTAVLEAYGLTETSPAVTMNPMYLKAYNGSIGLPVPSTEISIRDDAGQELPIGEQGELCIKGPQVMEGYWNQPEEDKLVFWSDGYLRTGDIAKIDESGFIYLIDRKKDMILVSGFNVYPAEIEHIIHLQPGVLEVGVVGVTHQTSGEIVKACIVKKDPDLTPEVIISHCKAHLTPYKIPKVIEFCDELPKTNVGKILRRALK